MKKILFSICLLFSLPLAALEVRVHPGEVIYTWEVDLQRGLSTVVLQNVAVVQKDGGPVTVDSLEVQVIKDGQAMQTLVIPAADLDRAAGLMRALEAQGALKLYDFHFQTSRYLNGLRLSGTRTLEPGTALVVSSTPLLLKDTPDKLTILARGKDAEGKAVEARGTLKVKHPPAADQYILPLAGTWYVGAAPELRGTHRWVANQEFAFDFGQLGPDGRTHKGDGSRLDDYYAYGKDVLAVADGEVVEAGADATEANDRLRRADESEDAFMLRTLMEQNKLVAQSYRAPLGNYVIIRHAGGEYSQYAHLKQGSVKVKAGDKVKRGQVIGQLGHTGNSTEPHLHFQLTDGPDPMYSRGLPIVFKNTFVEALGMEGRPLQTGWVVTTK
jgi:murein DD-endopeptidase MepM/ murein hydrolase activator NlpD